MNTDQAATKVLFAEPDEDVPFSEVLVAKHSPDQLIELAKIEQLRRIANALDKLLNKPIRF
jgi:hypothetical protein